MGLSAVIALLAAVACTAAAPTIIKPYSLHQKRDFGDESWIKHTRVAPNSILPIRIALAQSNLHRGHDWLMDVADPKSPNFAKHWTESEVNAAFAPSEESIAQVIEWLVENGITHDRISISHNSGWIAFDSPVAEAEGLFLTTFYEGQERRNGAQSVACDEYSLPEHLVEHIDYIKPGVTPARLTKKSVTFNKRDHHSQSPRPHRIPHNWPHRPTQSLLQHQDQTNLSSCGTYITPPCVYALYNITQVEGSVDPANSLGVFEEGDYYAQKDLDDYFTTFLPQIPNGTHPIPNFIDGAVAPVPVKKAGGESELDLTIAYSLIYPQTLTLYQTDDPHRAAETLDGQLNGFLDTFLDGIDGSFCNYSAYGQTGNDPKLDPVYPDPVKGGYKGQLQCGKYKLTNVLSASYLFGEAGLPVNYQRRQCNEWMKLALQGHTILFASGDYGVASFPNKMFPNGTCLGKNHDIFYPEGPSTCPWITSVGATQIPVNGSVYEPEEAARALFGDGSLFTSSGGFSNIFPIPDYQKDAVAHYFEVQNPPYPYYETTLGKNIGANGGRYNRIGRGFPDISAVGRFWLDYVANQEVGYGGTSMATPIVASIINRIVEERLKRGKGPIGFLNTHIYSNPQLFHDITKGSNFGCNSTGFETAPGWDPVTGMGTPNYPAMLEYFLNLP